MKPIKKMEKKKKMRKKRKTHKKTKKKTNASRSRHIRRNNAYNTQRMCSACKSSVENELSVLRTPRKAAPLAAESPLTKMKIIPSVALRPPGVLLVSDTLFYFP